MTGYVKPVDLAGELRSSDSQTNRHGQRSQFEALPSERSATFTALPAERVAGEIKQASKRIVEFSGTDRFNDRSCF